MNLLKTYQEGSEFPIHHSSPQPSLKTQTKPIQTAQNPTTIQDLPSTKAHDQTDQTTTHEMPVIKGEITIAMTGGRTRCKVRLINRHRRKYCIITKNLVSIIVACLLRWCNTFLILSVWRCEFFVHSFCNFLWIRSWVVYRILIFFLLDARPFFYWDFFFLKVILNF